MHVGDYSNDGYVIGHVFADVHSDGDCLENMEVSLDQIASISQSVRKTLKQDKNPSLLLGTRSC